MKDTETVSVIIPTYKRTERLERAIKSVIKQTYPNIELIIVDDNGKDSVFTSKISKMINVKYKSVVSKYIIHEKNSGGAAARNTGIKASTGKYIALLDDDDEFLPDKLSKQVRKIKKLDTTWGGVYCGYAYHISDLKIGEKNYSAEGNLLLDLFLQKNNIAAGSTLLARKEVFSTIGLFDTEFKRHQDWEFMIRFFSKYKIAVVNEILVILHRDDNQNKPSAEEMAKVKVMFFEKFKNVIDSFSNKNRNEIYKRHILGLVKAFCQEKKYIKAFHYYKTARSYARLSFIEFGNLCFVLVNSIIPFNILKRKIIMLFKRNT